MILYAHARGHQLSLFTTLHDVTLPVWRTIENVPFSAVTIHLPDGEGITKINITPDYLQILHELVEKPNAQFMSMAEPLPEVAEVVKPKFNYEESPFNFKFCTRAGNVEGIKKHKYFGRVHCSLITQQRSAYVMLPDASVHPCCMDFGLRHPLGNLLTQDYSELKDSSEMMRVRRSARTFSDEYALCRTCEIAYTDLMQLHRLPKLYLIEALKTIGLYDLARHIFRHYYPKKIPWTK
jgi:radical SAM protein with 4Fe4S-binding SPASM domain